MIDAVRAILPLSRFFTGREAEPLFYITGGARGVSKAFRAGMRRDGLAALADDDLLLIKSCVSGHITDKTDLQAMNFTRWFAGRRFCG